MRVMKQVTEHRRVFRRDGGEGWTDRAQTSLWTISAMSYVSAIDWTKRLSIAKVPRPSLKVMGESARSRKKIEITLSRYIRRVVYSVCTVFFMYVCIKCDRSSTMKTLAWTTHCQKEIRKIVLTDDCVVRSFSAEPPGVHCKRRSKKYVLTSSLLGRQNKISDCWKLTRRPTVPIDRSFAWTGKMFIGDRDD